MNTEKNIPHLQSESQSGGTACTFPTLSVRIPSCGIYKITSPSNKIYIGQSKNVKSRIRYYRKLHCKTQRKIYCSIKKYGWDKHKFEIIHECNPEQLNELEIYYINLFQTFATKHGMNLRGGGGNHGSLSAEHKRKIGNANRGRISNRKGVKLSEETKAKISKAKIGNKHACKNKSI